MRMRVGMLTVSKRFIYLQTVKAKTKFWVFPISELAPLIMNVFCNSVVDEPLSVLLVVGRYLLVIMYE